MDSPPHCSIFKESFLSCLSFLSSIDQQCLLVVFRLEKGEALREYFIFLIFPTRTLCNSLSMMESEKFLMLQKLLADDAGIKKVLKTASAVTANYTELGKKSLISSEDLRRLGEELNELRIPAINEVLRELKVPPAIVAFPIHKTQQYTLFFVIVPAGRRFDWHSHPQMGGISKCFHGRLRITALHLPLLRPYSYNTFLLPRASAQLHDLRSTDPNTIALIEPTSYNAHKIEALELSAFFDLLVPDYPANTCQFFTTIDENSQSLLLQQVPTEKEDIMGWDVYYEQLLASEKHIVKNYILK